MSDILLSTQGSLGDLYPIMGIGEELQHRGHRVILATNPYYRETVDSAGFDFQPVGERIDPTDPELLENIVNQRSGTQYLLRHYISRDLRGRLEALLPLARQADLLVSSPITLMVRVAAELTGTPWSSVVFSPVSLWSYRDPPAVPPLPELVDVPLVGPWLTRGIMALGAKISRFWLREYDQIRSEHGLKPAGHPMLEAPFSPHGTLALFSNQLIPPACDWPEPLSQPGFVYYDESSDQSLSGELETFLNRGPAPVAVTLGSSACRTERAFEIFKTARSWAERGSHRLLLIAGDRYADELRRPELDHFFVTDYVPYSRVFHRCSILVHQGGSGTLGEAMRAGRPMIVLPFSHDQFEHARRVEKGGFGLRLKAKELTAEELTHAISTLRSDSSYEQTAQQISKAVRDEPGAVGAADTLENILATNSGPNPDTTNDGSAGR